MRIFVVGVGGTGSLLAQLLARQGHTVWCGDRDVERARRFLGKKSLLEVVELNARNIWSVIRAGRGCHLLVNASPAVFNEILLRAALHLRAHYLDLNSRLTRNPFKAEQLRYHKRFIAKNRIAVINGGAAPGLTNLLVKRGTEILDTTEGAAVRLFESTISQDPISTWSPEVAFDEAVSKPIYYRGKKFHKGKRFGDPERFRFPPPIGETNVYLAAQDEVATLPYYVALHELDAKIGGNDIERLRRWYRQGKLSKSRGIVSKRFPKTSTPARSRPPISRQDSRKCAIRRGRAGARIEKRPAAACSLGRRLSQPFSNCPARNPLDANFLRDGPYRSALRAPHASRHGGRLSARGASRRSPAGDSCGHALARHSDFPQDDSVEKC